MFSQCLIVSLLCLSFSGNAAPTVGGDNVFELDRGLEERQASTPYAPITTTCPSSLIRPARGLSSGESSYVSTRQTQASSALLSWLQQTGSFNLTSLPVIGFASSGGGYRSLLTTAGVVQALDSRDSSTGVSGVYQGLTYESGLSGGAWFLGSLAGNNWPTVSSLKKGLWTKAFKTSLLVPSTLLSTAESSVYSAVSQDIAAKKAAGYNVTVIDPWGRLLSYQLLYGSDGGVQDTLSGLTSLSNFTSHSVPYPIIVITTNFPDQGQCFPSITGPIFEFHPYEYGSWDQGISAFATTQYMGTNITNGKPTTSSTCTANYDNIGYIFGTSSDIFNGLAGGACFTPTPDTTDLPGVLEGIIAKVEPPSTQDIFGIYPNPFYKYRRSSLVNTQPELSLSDGGEAGQNNPIWPFIQPARNIDLVIVNDNSADTTDNFPNGTEIYQTYLNAQQFGLTKMPTIPPVSTFVSEGLNKRATFFGCNETGTVFIVYLPNVAYTFPSGQPTSRVQYSVRATNGMIANGVLVATQNGDEEWPVCLACAVASKAEEGGGLPGSCGGCFEKYCYTG